MPQKIDDVLNGVSRETIGLLEAYCNLILKWQPKINLIAPSTAKGVWERHIEDSAQCYGIKPEANSWIDLGSGAGFPGLVVAVLLSDASNLQMNKSVSLVESNGKKTAFLKTVARELDLQGRGVDIGVYNDRIENALPKIEHCDVITARALASLTNLFELTEGRIQQNCKAVFQKGRQYQDEIEEAKKVWQFNFDVHPSRVQSDSVLIEFSNVARLK